MAYQHHCPYQDYQNLLAVNDGANDIAGNWLVATRALDVFDIAAMEVRQMQNTIGLIATPAMITSDPCGPDGWQATESFLPWCGRTMPPRCGKERLAAVRSHIGGLSVGRAESLMMGMR